ncbi:MAG TPA: MFS transporter [Candidatus Limnocylindrales bacterium]|nr:MFS transporter [Candidatus Limnocylindrales bacterium]
MTIPGAAARRRVQRSGAFSHRNYRVYFGGQVTSLVGTWMQQVAQAWLVLQIGGGNPLWLGVVAAAQYLPVMLFGLFGGIVADVLPKRQTLLWVQVVMMVLAAILAVLTFTGLVEVWMVIVMAVLLGCANTIDMPVRQAFTIEMVGPRDIGNAVALNSAAFNGARIVGPAVAGLAIGTFGIATAFAVNAASFLAVIVSLMVMRDDALFRTRSLPRPRSVGAVLDNLAEGLAFVRHTPLVLMALTTVGLTATFGMNFNVIVPPLAQDVLGSDASGYGFLMTASGVGALSAALGLAMTHRVRPVIVAIGSITLGVASIALSVVQWYPLALLLMVPIGAGGIAMAATANTTIQLAVPDALRGRVMSVYTTAFSASVPIGGLAAGALAGSLGILPTIALGGGLSLVVGLVALVWWQRIGRDSPRADRLAAPTAEATSGVADGVRAPSPLAVGQSTAPSTSAAFKPPKPNEVLSTRR